MRFWSGELIDIKNYSKEDGEGKRSVIIKGSCVTEQNPSLYSTYRAIKIQPSWTARAAECYTFQYKQVDSAGAGGERSLCPALVVSKSAHLPDVGSHELTNKASRQKDGRTYGVEANCKGFCAAWNSHRQHALLGAMSLL